MLPLSGLSVRAVSTDTPGSPHMLEISSESVEIFNAVRSPDGDARCSVSRAGPTVDAKVFTCPSAAEVHRWMQLIDDRRYKSLTLPLSPSHCALSYLVKTNRSPTHTRAGPVPVLELMYYLFSCSCPVTSTGNERN